VDLTRFRSARYWQEPRPGSLRDRRDALAAFAFIGANQAVHRIRTMCRVLGVSPGGCYAWLKRPLSTRARADAELSARIAEIHQRSRATHDTRQLNALVHRKLFKFLSIGVQLIGRVSMTFDLFRD
jgi:hypothetical protein